MTDKDLRQIVEQQRDLMIAVATGGPRIDTVSQAYSERRNQISQELQNRGIADPNPYPDLWAWYGKWSSRDLPSYQSRRDYISGLNRSLLDALDVGGTRKTAVAVEVTGWPRVDRDLGDMRVVLASAKTEPDFQSVGLRCREILISVAQEVYDPKVHPTLDGIAPSSTDAKRMLEAYIAIELRGGPNEEARKHAKAALDLAIVLQHRRTATFREAALCAEATTALVNTIAVLSGRRDPN